MLVPMLDEIISGAGDQGVRHTLLGMAHRGRLNVLAHVLDKPYAEILAEFKDSVQRTRAASICGWRGDVKYHAGARTASPRGQMFVTLVPNPSHLEAVNPVVEGMARAAGTRTAQAGTAVFDPAVTLPILIHGDTAFPGQGIVAETLNLSGSQLRNRRHHPHHRQQPAWIHCNAPRVVQHKLRKWPRPGLQDSDRPRECGRPGRVPRGGAAGVGVSCAFPSRFPDRPRRLPAIRPQRG